MPLTTITPAAWWCCRCCKRLSDWSMRGFWACCCCAHLNNPAYCPMKCGNCGHSKCAGCNDSVASLRAEDNLVSSTENRSDREYQTFMTPTDQSQQPVQIGSLRKICSADCACSSWPELTQTCGRCGHRKCAACTASITFLWAEDDIESSTEDRSDQQYNASMAPLDQPEPPVQIGFIRALSPANSVCSSDFELTELFHGLLIAPITL